MSMPNSNPKGGSFFQSTGGQTLVFVVVAAIVILLAWRYVF